MNLSDKTYPDSSSLAWAWNRVERRGLRLPFAVACVILWTMLGSNQARSEILPVDFPSSALNSVDQQSYQQATKWMAEGRWEDASVALKGIIRRNSGGVLALPAVAIDLVRAMAHLGRREEAVSLLDQALSQEKKSRRRELLLSRVRIVSRMFLTNATFQVYQDGINLLDAGKYRAAREKFEKALEKEPDNVEVLVRVGQCLLMEGDEDSAAERLRFARKLNPYEAETKLWLGRALHRRGELKQALEDLRAASSELMGSERASLWYAEALFASGKKASAIQHLDAAISRNPIHLENLIALARMKVDSAQSGESRREELLWSARKDLQLALSRLVSYKGDGGENQTSTENELEEGAEGSAASRSLRVGGSGLSFEPRRSANSLREEISLLQQRVEKALSAGSSG